MGNDINYFSLAENNSLWLWSQQEASMFRYTELLHSNPTPYRALYKKYINLDIGCAGPITALINYVVFLSLS